MPGSAGSKAPELVGSLLENARSTTARAAGRALDGEAWRRAVGPRISERTSPGKLHHGVLTVNVASAVWAQELSFLERDLIERLRGVGIAVSSLRFRVSEAVRRAPEQRGERRKPAPPPIPLPADLEARLAAVDDPELRAAIAEAAGHWLAQRQAPAATSPKRPARGPRPDARESGRPDPAAARPRVASRRNSGGDRGSGR